MKNILITLGLSILILSSCSTEKKVEISEKYVYHKIVECTIPVHERFDKILGKKTHPYNRAYAHIINREEAKMNAFYILKPNKRLKNDFLTNAHRKSYKEIESKYGNFKIYKSNLYNPVTKSLMKVTYELMGEKIDKKTYISFEAPTEVQGKEELDYLLEYCQQTWRTSKKKEEE